jgi:hypothetical protein
MHDVYAITTHNKDELTERAAMEWHDCGVCAIGWSKCGNLRKIPERKLKKDPRLRYARQLFLEIQPNDVVIAYAKRNIVAYMGKVKDGYTPNNTNTVGRILGYPNQLLVDWWDEPHHFDRKDLPSWLARQFPIYPGQTIKRFDLGSHGFEGTIKIIEACAVSMSALPEIENLAKAGLRKYLYQRMKKLEKGLRPFEQEKSTSEGDRPDFTAVDKNDTPVLVECKGTGREKAIKQLSRYGRDFEKKEGNRKPRLLLVAFNFDDACKKAARSQNIQLVECDLSFTSL